jgi:phosphoserine phosphatase
MNAESRFISLSAVGLDAPGLVATITEKIFALDGNIIDVEENCRRGLFSIFLIVDFSASRAASAELVTQLETIRDTTGLQVIVRTFDEGQVVAAATAENHLVTIIGEDRPGIIAGVSRFFSDRNINIENCRMIARGRFFSMEMVVDTRLARFAPDVAREAAIEQVKCDLKGLCAAMGQSVVIQSGNIYHQNKKLVVFDVESALIRNFSLQHFISQIRRKIHPPGAANEGAADTAEDGMQRLIENAKLLKGLPIEELRRLSELLQLNPGTFELIRILKSMGFKVALISTGFHFFIKRIFETAPLPAQTTTTSTNRILIIGSGPIVIGQACEFDYSEPRPVQRPAIPGI